MKKVIIILILTVLAVTTVAVISLKPKMHKTIMLESIIYKKVK